MGKPTNEYPYAWSIYRWIDGKTVAFANNLDLEKLAVDLAQFIIALQCIDTTEAPLPGGNNFYRDDDLSIYDEEAKKALALLTGKMNTDLVRNVWESALKTKWDKPPV